MNATNELIRDYLARLERATADLPPDLREDVRTDVRAHLDELTASSISEADLRTALDRLGAPEAIAGAAREPDDGPPAGTAPPPPPRRPSRALDIAAVVLLLIGAFVVPGIGWLVGVVLLWVSASWTIGEKLLGSLVWPGGLAAPLLVGLLGVRTITCERVTELGPDGIERVIVDTCDVAPSIQPWLGAVVWIAVLLAPVLVAILLLRRAEARRRAA